MYSILIADDEVEIRHGLLHYIAWAEMGYEVQAEMENGAQVIEYLKRKPVDVVLCDIRMPVATGLDVARYVHEQGLRTIVVLLSAYQDFEYARTAMAYGVQHYVVKSARYAELIKTFRAVQDTLGARNPDGAAAQDDAMIAAVKAYVRNHLDTVSLETASAHVGRSTSYVSRFFKQRTGQGFSEYLIQERMEYAARLLCDLRVHTYEVAERVGYANPKNFTRTFRRHYGISPRTYRNSRAPAGRRPT